MTQAIELYIMIISAALPFGIAFAIGDLLVGTFMRAAFKGRLEFKM